MWPLLILALFALHASPVRCEKVGILNQPQLAAAKAGRGIQGVVADSRPHPALGASLVSGVADSFTIGPQTAPALFADSSAYRITVPPEARRLEVTLVTTTPEADLDLHIRREAPPDVVGGQIVADFGSASFSGYEAVTISGHSDPVLEPGIYYISVAVFTTDVSISGYVVATWSTDDYPGFTLSSGVPSSFQFQAVSQPTFFTGANTYRIAVPPGATRLDISLDTVIPDSAADVDLYVRRNVPPELESGAVLSDYESIGGGGTESVAISTTTSPALTAGTYYLRLGLHTTGTDVEGLITATIAGGAAACDYDLTPANSAIGPDGGAGSATINTQPGCAWSASSDSPWLTVSSASSGTGSATISYSAAVNPGGARTATLTVAGQTHNVTQAAASSACTYTFDPAESSLPAAGGSGSTVLMTAEGCSWTVSGDVAWITITSAASGVGSATINYSAGANPTTNPRSGSLSVAGQMFTVNQEAGSGGGPLPQIHEGGVVNGADYTPSFAPGILFSVFGVDLAAETTLAESVPLPRSLAGVSVEILDGERVLLAPLVFVSPGQINAQLPFALESSTVRVRVRTAVGVSNVQEISVTERAPRLLTKTLDGQGEAIIVHANWSVVTEQDPAVPGEVLVLFLTGLGEVSPAIAAGEPGGDGGAGGDLNWVSAAVEVLVNGIPAVVHFAGLAPGFPGLYQINFGVPAGVGDGVMALSIRVRDHASQAGVGFRCSSVNWQPMGVGTVGASGGTVSGNGVSLTVPAGGFDADQNLTIYSATASEPGYAVQVGQPFGITGLPDTTAAPITIEASAGGPLDPDHTYLAVQEPGGGEFYVKAVVDGGLVKAILPPRAGAGSEGGNDAADAAPRPAALSARTVAESDDLGSILVMSLLTGLLETKSYNGTVSVLYEGSVGSGLAQHAADTIEERIALLRNLGISFPYPSIPMYLGEYDGSLREPWGEVRHSTWTNLSSIKIDMNFINRGSIVGIGTKEFLAAKTRHLFVHLFDEARVRQHQKDVQREPNLWAWASEAAATAAERSGRDDLYISRFAIENFRFLSQPGLAFTGTGQNAWNHGAGASLFLNSLSDFEPEQFLLTGLVDESPLTALAGLNPLSEDWVSFSRSFSQGRFVHLTHDDWIVGLSSEVRALAAEKRLVFTAPGSRSETLSTQNLSTTFFEVKLDYAPSPGATLEVEAIGGSHLKVMLFAMKQDGTAIRPLQTAGQSSAKVSDIARIQNNGESILVTLINSRVGPPYDGDTFTTLEVKVTGQDGLAMLQPTVAMSTKILGEFVCSVLNTKYGDTCPPFSIKQEFDTTHWEADVAWDGRAFQFEALDEVGKNATTLSMSGQFSPDGQTLETVTLKYKAESTEATETVEYTFVNLPYGGSPRAGEYWEHVFRIFGPDQYEHLANLKMEYIYGGEIVYSISSINWNSATRLPELSFSVISNTPGPH